MGAFKKHRFAKQIREDLKPLYALDNWHGPLSVAEDAVVIMLAILAPYFLRPVMGWMVPYFLISLPLIGFRMRGLATLLHESSHKSLAKNPALNFFLGTFCSGYLIFQSWWAYWTSHVLGHHTHLGNGRLDPDYLYHLQEGLYKKQSQAGFVWRNLVGPLLLLKTPSKIMDLFRYRFFSKDEPRWEKWVKGLYLTVVIGGIVFLGFGRELLLFWIVPYLTMFPIVNWYIELTEHYPFVGESDLDVLMSRNRWTGPLGRLFLGIHAEHMHLTHHLLPRCPFWNLERAHMVLMRDETYRSAQSREAGFLWPVIAGVPSILANIVRHAALLGTSK